MEGGGEDDAAEDVAAGGTQHQLRVPSGGATSLGGARTWRGRSGGADALASPWRGGADAAPQHEGTLLGPTSQPSPPPLVGSSGVDSS